MTDKINEENYQKMLKERVDLLSSMQLKLISNNGEFKTDLNTGLTISAIGPSCQILIQSFIENKAIPDSWKYALICGFDFIPEIKKEFLESISNQERERLTKSLKFLVSKGGRNE